MASFPPRVNEKEIVRSRTIGKLLLNLVDHTEVVRDLTFAPDGSLILVSASRDKTLRVWDLKDDGNMMKVLRGHQNWVYSCAFSPDSSMLCSVGATAIYIFAVKWK
uniref:WD repeat and SOCS box-containing protein 1 n=1 Tax=Moschus moschiferus TaxID=68415 RepID=A0A8C6CSB7_MOSMO